MKEETRLLIESGERFLATNYSFEKRCELLKARGDNQTVLDMKDVKTIKKCRMSIPGVKKAMVLQIVLTNEVYTSEVIKDVESVSKNLSRDLHLQFSSGELCEYRK